MKTNALILVASIAACGHAVAGGNHEHSHQARHGGVVAEAHKMDFELVTAADAIRLYVRGQGKPVDLAQASARLTLLAGSQKQEIELKPAGDKLEALGPFKTGAGTKAVAVVTINGKPATVRFVLK